MIEEDTNIFLFHALKSFSYISNYINKHFYVITQFKQQFHIHKFIELPLLLSEDSKVDIIIFIFKRFC